MAPDKKRKESDLKYYEKHKEKILLKNKESPLAKAAREKYRNKPETKEKSRNYRLFRDYGITINDYELLLTSQKYQCAGCGVHQAELELSLCVDHDHATGEVRGLLCGGCNRALGLVKDNTQTLANLIRYLSK